MQCFIFFFGIITPHALAVVCHLAGLGAVTHTDWKLHHPVSSPSAHVDVSAHESACVSCLSALKLVSISSLVITNFPLMLPRSQRRGDVNGCPSARRSAQSAAEEFDKCARARVCVRSVLTAQCNDVAAVFVDKLLCHRLLHDLLHLHTKKGNR